jgi:nucleotide-binding universal stress UspA family protein
MFKNVLVMLGLDHRDNSVLDAVIEAAPLLGFERLSLAHIHNRDPLPGPLAALAGSRTLPEAPPELEEARARVAAALPGQVVEALHLVGIPEVELRAAVDSHDIDLVVLGRNPAVDGQPGWGSSRRKLLRLTTCSVLVVPYGSHLNLERVVLGMDFSQYATLCLGVACRIAKGIDCVYQYDTSTLGDSGVKHAEFREKLHQHAREWFDEILPQIGYGGRRPNFIAHSGGKVADVLIGYAKHDPIVMGSRGLTPLAALLLGSSADRTASHSLGPVFIVRKKGATMNLMERLFHRTS